MSTAQVQSIDLLKDFRIRLWKFAETAGNVLSDAEGEMERALVWLDTEQQSYWKDQIVKRTQLLAVAKQALLVKKLAKRADGSHPPVVEEEKAVKLAVQRLEEAEYKLAAVHRWRREFQKEILHYKGSIQSFSSAVVNGIPAAVHCLDQLTTSLEAYLSAVPGDETAASGAIEQGLPPVSRPEPAEDAGAQTTATQPATEEGGSSKAGLPEANEERQAGPGESGVS
ncbi:MAG TPA: hypothetical protein PKV86_10515 [Syntrophobacteraceae bacterium]|nr:hypothetical protein [Syntrophobacteraceae bacterium]